MSGVFLSYSRADRALAHQMVRRLRALGVDAWWDEDMPGVDWQAELERQIKDLAAVVVLWTPVSLNSKNVRDEARLGQNTEKLVNALCGVAAPPFPFDRTNGLPLGDWNGTEPHGGWTRLIKTVEEHLVRAGDVAPGSLVEKHAEQERLALAAKLQAKEAEEAFGVARADEAEVSRHVERADAALGSAQEQLRRVMAMRGSATLLRAAQAELERTIAAKEEADLELAAVNDRLADASRRLARTRGELEQLSEIGPVFRTVARRGRQLPPAPALSRLPVVGRIAAMFARIRAANSPPAANRPAWLTPGYWSPFDPIVYAAVLLLLGVYIALRLILMQSSDPAMTALRALNPSDPLRLSRAAVSPPASPSNQLQTLQTFLAPEIAAHKVVVLEDATTVRVRTTIGELFKSGSDQLNAGQSPLFVRIGQAIQQTQQGPVSVEGDTDSDEVSTLTFPDNMALSQARALTVGAIIKTQLADQTRVTTVGLGDTQPIASNDTADGKSQNRRVEVVLQRSQ